jgi:hypothetical protein
MNILFFFFLSLKILLKQIVIKLECFWKKKIKNKKKLN